MIHPTASIHPEAILASDVQVGPFAVIDRHVTLGSGCVVGPHAYLTGKLEAGGCNIFHAGCVIGDAPQDLRFKEQLTGVVIGAGNTFREHVTIHRSNNPAEPTLIGSGNFLMANSHVGHNTRLGDNVIIANGALLAGHVKVESKVFISGNCLVHQFVRIGQFALMQGGAGISKDLPPFTIARGNNNICGLNTIGLRRGGFNSQDRLQLRKLYHFLFRDGRNIRSSLPEARGMFPAAVAQSMIDFIEQSRRGVVSDPGGIDEAEETSEEY